MMEKTLGPFSTRFVRRSYRRKFFTPEHRLDWPAGARDKESVTYVNEKVASLDDVLERCDGAQATFLPFIRDILWYVPLLLRSCNCA